MRRFTEFALATTAAFVGAAFPLGRAAAEPLPADQLAEPVVADKMVGAEGDYLRRLHAHVHKRWADNFPRLVGEKLERPPRQSAAAGGGEPDFPIPVDGQMRGSGGPSSWGFPGFDDAIGGVRRDGVPSPHPPQEIRSDDDKLHL